MQSHELRERFLAFFRQRGHTVVPSDSLIPSGDPTVLFTSAGMNQFKDYFLGKRTDVKRAASCQKCLRTGDLERVGKTPSHHSFFEMLGNFSFGDYFKREAIQWAWEFLTGTLDYEGKKPSPDPSLCVALPASKLWISIYDEDDEAFQLWRALGVPESRIKRFGQAENFWPANAPMEGPNGPCGPCSEIYYDPTGAVDSPKSVEVWNLVFTQFDRQPDGSLKPLPKPNIDTGMGLERLTRVIHGFETDYETDLFAPIIKEIQSPQPKNFSRTEHVMFAERALADHMRAIVFLIAEGLLPSNTSRGYVLRMLIRRAHGLARIAGVPAGSSARPDLKTRLSKEGLIKSVVQAMEGSPYKLDWAKVLRVLSDEESQFVETLESAESRLQELVRRLQDAKQTMIPGEEAFKLYDTHGFPLELTIDLAKEYGLTVDRAGFEKALQAQQERSRSASQFGQGIFAAPTLKLGDDVKVEFVGYEALEAEGRVKGIWKQTEWVQSAKEGEEIGVVLDRSPFYGESGGQIGDRGVIESPRGHLEVIDTKWVGDLLVHSARVVQGSVSVEEPVRAKVDAAHRLRVARSHTATHLVHWALRKVLGPETVQAGSLVDAERVRFDFSALGALREEQRLSVEQLVNDRIRAADAVRVDEKTLEEAKQAGALALFGEKYGQKVRMVSIGDYSRELCGGTHLVHTGSIGSFQILSESAIAARTRRLEILVGETAANRQQQESQLLRRVAERFSRPPDEVLQGLEELVGQLKAAERKLTTAKLELAQMRAKQLLADAKQLKGVTVVTAQVDGADREFLAVLADAARSALPGEGVICLVSGKAPVSIVMATTAGLVKQHRLHAGEMMKAVAPLIQGSGGGRPDFAQGGGKDPAGIPAVFQRINELIQGALER